MNDTDTIVQYSDTDLEMRFEPLEVTADLVMTGLTLWDTPIKGLSSRLHDGIRDLLELSWDAWPATVGVSQISISAEPNPLSTAWTPPEVVWAWREHLRIRLRTGRPRDHEMEQHVRFS